MYLEETMKLGCFVTKKCANGENTHQQGRTEETQTPLGW